MIDDVTASQNKLGTKGGKSSDEVFFVCAREGSFKGDNILIYKQGLEYKN